METNPQSHTEPRPNTDRQHDTNHSDGKPCKPEAEGEESCTPPDRQGNELPKVSVFVNGSIAHK
jgi:hypothetical protein